jgi:hypothetical protein
VAVYNLHYLAGFPDIREPYLPIRELQGGGLHGALIGQRVDR